VIVEGCSNTDHPGGVDAPEMFGDPAFLLEQTQPDPHDVGASPVDQSNQLLVLLRPQVPEGRCVRADADKTGVLGREFCCELFGNSLLPAIEEVPPPAGLAVLAAGELQNGAVTTRDAKSMEPADERHADSVADRDVSFAN
jgi:hypothetical protein